jgi:hypothetical protein
MLLDLRCKNKNSRSGDGKATFPSSLLYNLEYSFALSSKWILSVSLSISLSDFVFLICDEIAESEISPQSFSLDQRQEKWAATQRTSHPTRLLMETSKQKLLPVSWVFFQCRGSGFSQVRGSGSGSRRAKMTNKKKKKSYKISCFWRAEGFSYTLDVLNGVGQVY